MMNMIFILQGGGQSILSSVGPLLVMFVIIFFFFIRPQVKKQKEQMAFQKSLNKGDEVVTLSGIIGHISKIDEHEVTLQTSDKVFLRFTRSAVSKEMTDSFKQATSK